MFPPRCLCYTGSDVRCNMEYLEDAVHRVLEQPARIGGFREHPGTRLDAAAVRLVGGVVAADGQC